MLKKDRCPYYENAWQWHGDDLPQSVIVINETTSVLDDAWQLMASGNFLEWSSILASSQSNGRGQTRRPWQSPVGNIYVALRLPNHEIFKCTAAAPALSAIIINAFQFLNIPLQLKWPNDLVCAKNVCKIGGILLEERHGIVVAGIGINVEYAPPKELLRENTALSAGMLKLDNAAKANITCCNETIINDEIYLAERLWLYLVSKIYFCYTASLPASWLTKWKHEAEQSLLWRGQKVQLSDFNSDIFGIVNGLGPAGELELLLDGKPKLFNSGSLTLCASN